MSFRKMFVALQACVTEGEEHPEAKSLADYFTDTLDAVNSIKYNTPDAEMDPAFERAAMIYEELVPLLLTMETESFITANNLLDTWTEEMKKIGSDSVIDVEGEPSKQLAIKLIDIYAAMNEKKYWPQGDCAMLKSVYTVRAEERIAEFDKRIASLLNKISAYNLSNVVSIGRRMSIEPDFRQKLAQISADNDDDQQNSQRPMM